MADERNDDPPESFQQFLTASRSGYVYAGPDAKIVFVNERFSDWLKTTPERLVGTRLTDHFPIARKVYFETHLAPLLRMQGFFDEVAMELCRADGERLPVLVSAVERHDATGAAQFICYTFFPAVERRKFERNLVATKAAVTTDNSRLREQIAEQSRERLKVEETLSTAQHAAALREQFIAVLGHDLRNPLAAIDGAMRLLLKTPLNDRASGIVGMVQQSIGRMAALIDDVMDFARGRLGQGIDIKPKAVDLTRSLEHVVRELQTAWPNREILFENRLSGLVYCDSQRLAQLLSNLIANALTHGAAEGPVRVRAATMNNDFELAVLNSGEPIPEQALTRLFEPFTREDIRPSQQGLGLGLYIASEIARAHKGHLTVRSSREETCFTLKMPMAAN